MSGLIGRKIGMTSIFDENGKNIPCTVIEAGPCCYPSQNQGVDGYKRYNWVSMTRETFHKALGHFKSGNCS
jgi:large subunit ribosomal protein L3